MLFRLNMWLSCSCQEHDIYGEPDMLPVPSPQHAAALHFPNQVYYASACQASWKLPHARSLFMGLTESWPKQHDTHFCWQASWNLGLVKLLMHAPEAALQCFSTLSQHASQTEVDAQRLHLLRAAALADLGQPGEAVQALEVAAQLQGGFLPSLCDLFHLLCRLK